MSNKVNNVPQHKTIPATPATPDTGFGKIYIKSDRMWYGLDDLGAETPLSGGGGGGGGISLTDISAVSPLTYNNLTGSIGIGQSSGSTAGYLSASDWLTFNGKLSGSGTLNRILKWTPSGSQVGNSQLLDDGTKVNITSNPVTSGNAKFGVFTNSGVTSGIESSVQLAASALAGDVFGVSGSINQQTVLYGMPVAGKFTVGPFDSNFSAIAYGVYSDSSTNSTSFSIGGFFKAENTSGVPGAAAHAIQLQDGTQGTGKFLKSVTADGHANWSSLTASDVSGVQGELTLTTTGSSGAATLVGNTLNIPQYSGGGGFTWPSHIQYSATDKTLWVSGKSMGSDNTTYGNQALTGTTGILFGCSAFGYQSLKNNGYLAPNTGWYNSAFGSASLKTNTSGSQNAAFGTDSLWQNTTGGQNAAFGSNTLGTNTTGSQNVAIGANSSNQSSTGSWNTSVGATSHQLLTTGSNNVAIGGNAGGVLETGNDNIYIGFQTSGSSASSHNVVIGSGSISTYNHCIVLGIGAVSNQNNQFVVGSSSNNAGTIVTESVTANATWSVRINGQACKILINK